MMRFFKRVGQFLIASVSVGLALAVFVFGGVILAIVGAILSTGISIAFVAGGMQKPKEK